MTEDLAPMAQCGISMADVFHKAEETPIQNELKWDLLIYVTTDDSKNMCAVKAKAYSDKLTKLAKKGSA